MPTVKHRRARKDIPSAGIKAGEMYYSWKMRTQTGGVKRVSKTPPRPSQLTLSEFKSQWRAFGEEISDLAPDDDLYENLKGIAGRIRELGEEQRSKKEGMPDGLQEGDTGQLLETRADNCDTWADEIEGLNEPDAPEEQAVKEAIEREPGQTDADYETAQNDAWEEAKTDYEKVLEELKEEALDADPGEE